MGQALRNQHSSLLSILHHVQVQDLGVAGAGTAQFSCLPCCWCLSGPGRTNSISRLPRGLQVAAAATAGAATAAAGPLSGGGAATAAAPAAPHAGGAASAGEALSLACMFGFCIAAALVAVPAEGALPAGGSMLRRGAFVMAAGIEVPFKCPRQRLQGP